MPRYDFECDGCGYSAELVASYGDTLRCECGAMLRRVFPLRVSILDDPGRREFLKGKESDSLHAQWLDKNQADIGRRLRSGQLEPVSAHED